MHLFAKQINRPVTQTNISHGSGCVRRRVPEEKGGVGRRRKDGGKSVYSSLPQPAISILLKHAIPRRKCSLVQAHPSAPQQANAEPGNRGSYEQGPWCDGFQYIICLHIRFGRGEPGRKRPGSRRLTSLTTFIRMGGKTVPQHNSQKAGWENTRRELSALRIRDTAEGTYTQTHTHFRRAVTNAYTAAAPHYFHRCGGGYVWIPVMVILYVIWKWYNAGFNEVRFLATGNRLTSNHGWETSRL